MVGYTTDTKELIDADGDGIVLEDFNHYNVGNVRPLEEYLELTDINVEEMQCGTCHGVHKALWNKQLKEVNVLSFLFDSLIQL
jgi:hypothetical protein